MSMCTSRKLLGCCLFRCYAQGECSSSLASPLTFMCRVEAGGNRRVIDDLLKSNMLEVLRANDQLKRERKLGKVFLVSHPSPRLS